MRTLPLLVLSVCLVHSVSGAIIVNSQVEHVILEKSERVIIHEGGVVGTPGGSSAGILAIDEGYVNLDIYGGAVHGDITLLVDGPSTVTIKGGTINGLLTVPMNRDYTVEFFGSNLQVDPNEFGAIVSGALSDGTPINLQYIGDLDYIRLHDSEDFEDVTVCRGRLAFADRIISFDPGPDFDGVVPNLQDPLQALGTPNWVGAPNDTDTSGAVSLGNGGSITIEFVNNVLIPDGSSKPDLAIFEVGAIVEHVRVEISTDAETWIDLGTIEGNSTQIDIDAGPIQVDDFYHFARITDIEGQGDGLPTSSGAEIAGVATLNDREIEPVVTPLEICPAVEVKFMAYLDSVYQIESSPDAETWEIDGVQIIGDGTMHTERFSITDSKQFYRVRPALATPDP